MNQFILTDCRGIQYNIVIHVQSVCRIGLDNGIFVITGLKIPNSSVVEKEFFIIPKDYVTKGGNSGSYGVLRETYLEDGTATTEFVETTIYIGCFCLLS